MGILTYLLVGMRERRESGLSRTFCNQKGFSDLSALPHEFQGRCVHAVGCPLIKSFLNFRPKEKKKSHSYRLVRAIGCDNLYHLSHNVNYVASPITGLDAILR